MQQLMPNPEDITDSTTAINMVLSLMAKASKLNYSTPTNNNQRISSNPRNRQIAQPGINMGQDKQMQMIGGNGNQNQIGNGNLVAVRAEENAAGHNGNQIRYITDPTTAMNMALTLMAKAFKLNYSTPTHNNQRISSNPKNRQIAQPGMNMGQDRQMQMVGAAFPSARAATKLPFPI
nr:hypothetical protein [Tanacetum cinerariifolium]